MTIESNKYTDTEMCSPTYTVWRAGAEHVEFSRLISQWTIDSKTMLPKTVQDISNMFQNGHSVLVFNGSKEPVSHAAITYVYSDGTVEIGCVVTDINKRNNGAGTTAIKAVIGLANEMYPNKKIFALANSISAPIFEKLGARKMSSEELSDEVWGPCSICPKIPTQTPNKPFLCCDIPYDLTCIQE